MNPAIPRTARAGDEGAGRARSTSRSATEGSTAASTWAATSASTSDSSATAATHPNGSTALAPQPSRDVARTARERRQAAAREGRRLRRNYRLGLAGAWLVVTFVVTSVVLAIRSPYLAAEAFFITSVISVVSMPLLARIAVPNWLLERSLRAGDRDADLETRHLSPRLADLVRSTRLLRLGIECADPVDNGADRNIGAWIVALRRLPAEDLAFLGELGLSERGIESILFADEARDHSVDRRGVVEIRRRRMEVIAEQLEGFESALLGHRPDPYR